jgi:23S rRNA pseudouridine1911/1915/1917 synthase
VARPLATGDFPSVRLDRRLRLLHPDLSWTRVRELIAQGQVAVAGVMVRDAGYEVDADVPLAVDPSRPALPHARLDLARLHEDAEILVVDKPAGLLTIATDPSRKDIEDTVLRRVRDYARHLHGRRGYAGVLHRLDRDTSGALALALSREAHAAGRALFGAHRFERWYLAIVAGNPERERGTIEAAVSREYADGRRRIANRSDEGRHAVTHYRVLERFRDASLMELRLETGRQHQIRLHMEQLGHPLMGERVYTDQEEAEAPRSVRGVKRQMLHAWRLEFPHPLRRTVIDVEAPLPEDFERALRRLRGRGSNR